MIYTDTHTHEHSAWACYIKREQRKKETSSIDRDTVGGGREKKKQGEIPVAQVKCWVWRRAISWTSFCLSHKTKRGTNQIVCLDMEDGDGDAAPAPAASLQSLTPYPLPTKDTTSGG